MSAWQGFWRVKGGTYQAVPLVSGLVIDTSAPDVAPTATNVLDHTQ